MNATHVDPVVPKSARVSSALDVSMSQDNEAHFGIAGYRVEHVKDGGIIVHLDAQPVPVNDAVLDSGRTTHTHHYPSIAIVLNCSVAHVGARSKCYGNAIAAVVADNASAAN